MFSTRRRQSGPSAVSAGTTRRQALLAGAATLAAGALAAPRIARAQAVQLYVGGPATPGLVDIVFPVIEKKHKCKILYEGTRSFTNLEKMRANKAKPTMSVVLMDDPVMILAEDEQLIERLTPANVPNLAAIKPNARPRDAMWANYMQPISSVAYNSSLVKGGIGSYADMWDPKYKGKLILPSLQSTEGLWALLAAAHLETGKPFAEALKNLDAGFERLKKLKPNIMMIYNQSQQAMQLLETGEASLVSGIDSRGILFRKSQGAPVDLSRPKEGLFAMPAGIAKVKGGPHTELSYAFINEFLGEELQNLFGGTFYSFPTHPKAKSPAGFDGAVEIFAPDWEYVTRNRQGWIDRWEREISRG